MSEDQGRRIVLVYCPCPSLDVAEELGNALVGARLAGCVNILPRMISIYDWEGRRERSEEAVLIVKTSAALAGFVRAHLERDHPYDVPAILVLPLAGVNDAYAEWLLGAIGDM